MAAERVQRTEQPAESGSDMKSSGRGMNLRGETKKWGRRIEQTAVSFNGPTAKWLLTLFPGDDIDAKSFPEMYDEWAKNNRVPWWEDPAGALVLNLEALADIVENVVGTQFHVEIEWSDWEQAEYRI